MTWFLDSGSCCLPVSFARCHRSSRGGEEPGCRRTNDNGLASADALGGDFHTGITGPERVLVDVLILSRKVFAEECRLARSTAGQIISQCGPRGVPTHGGPTKRTISVPGRVMGVLDGTTGGTGISYTPHTLSYRVRRARDPSFDG